MLSPVLKLHIFRTYTCPRTSLSSFSLTTNQLEPIAIFQRKTLKSILKLSVTAPTPSVHFLTGELPIEGKIHRDIFSLFYGVWANPDTKIYHIVKYLFENTSENSHTWSAHLKHLSKMYGLEDPLLCLRKDPPSKSLYKEHVMTKITAFYENRLRVAAAKNSQMTFFNVAALGLRGRHHPALSNMATTNEVRISRPHLKMLSGNYLTYKMKSEQSGGSPLCRLCSSGQEESLSHVISSCEGLSVERTKIFDEFRQMCNLTKNSINFDEISNSEHNLTQFMLDPISLNLPVGVSLSDPVVADFYKLSRQYCYKIDKTRIGSLKKMFQDKQSD